MLKSTAGGGGIGMLRCDTQAELDCSFRADRRTGRAQLRGRRPVPGTLRRARAAMSRCRSSATARATSPCSAIAIAPRSGATRRSSRKRPAPDLPPDTRAGLHDAARRLGRGCELPQRRHGRVHLRRRTRRRVFPRSEHAASGRAWRHRGSAGHRHCRMDAAPRGGRGACPRCRRRPDLPTPSRHGFTPRTRPTIFARAPAN